MKSQQVTLPTQPNPTNATLHYEADYTQGGHWLDFLHLIRQGLLFGMQKGVSLEEDYWLNLNGFRDQFAADCGQATGSLDLLIDPPSHRGYHRPYLSAFKQVYSHAYWLAFGKTARISADINDMDSLRKAIKVIADSPGTKSIKARDIGRLLIVDDVYATGATAAVVVEYLQSKGMPATTDVYIAAPLRIPTDMMNKMADVLPGDLPTKGDAADEERI
jgi:hypothetical protein